MSLTGRPFLALLVILTVGLPVATVVLWSRLRPGQPAYAHKNFPGVEVFSGYPGNATSLVERMRYPEVLLKEILRHRARPMVLVMMRPSVNFPRDTECTDVPAGPQTLTFFAQDVTAQSFSPLSSPADGLWCHGRFHRWILFSQTCHAAAGDFPAAVALSGYYNTLKNNTTGDLRGGSLVLRKLNDLLWRLKHMPAPAVSLLVTTSRDENGPEGHSNTAAFLRLVKPPLFVDSIIQRHGGHNFATWSGQMPTALSWLSKKLPPIQAR